MEGTTYEVCAEIDPSGSKMSLIYYLYLSIGIELVSAIFYLKASVSDWLLKNMHH